MVSSVQSLSRVRLFATPWIAARQASLSITNSQNSLKLKSIESVMPSSHLILSSPSPPAPNPSQHQSLPMSQLFTWGSQSTGVLALASFLPKKSQGWSPSEWTGWISLQSKGLSRVFSNTTVQKHQFFGAQSYKKWRLGESEVMWWVAASSGSGNGLSCWRRDGGRRKENQCPAGGSWGVQVGWGGSRPGALSPPGPRFWDPVTWVRSRLTLSKGVHLYWWPLGSPGTSGSPTLSPGGLLGGAAVECGQLMMVKLPLLLFLLWLQLRSCRESSPTLTGGLSFPCLEAPAFPEWKYFESTWLSKISL